MHRLLILLISFILTLPALAQEADGPDPEAIGSSAEQAADAAAEAADGRDESRESDDDSDVSYDEEEDDGFIPSENVKFGQSIPFPTDI